MKIHKFGTVTLHADSPVVTVEGWNVEREDVDPADASDEQLLLAYAIYWAKDRFDKALTTETIKQVREIIRRQHEAKLKAS
jgi:hypothetical protein